MCLGVCLFGFILDMYIHFLHQVRQVFCNFSNRFSIPCPLSSPSGIPIDANVCMFEVVLWLLKTFLYLFGFLLKNVCCSYWVFSDSLSSKLLSSSSASPSLLLIPCNIVFISVNAVFISDRFPFYALYLHFSVSYLFVLSSSTLPLSSLNIL